MGQPTPRRVFEALVERAFWRGTIGRAGCSDGRHLDRYRRRGEDIPDDLLPGRMVLRLSPDEREALSGLTADMTQDRVGGVVL